MTILFTHVVVAEKCHACKGTGQPTSPVLPVASGRAVCPCCHGSGWWESKVPLSELDRAMVKAQGWFPDESAVPSDMAAITAYHRGTAKETVSATELLAMRDRMVKGDTPDA